MAPHGIAQPQFRTVLAPNVELLLSRLQGIRPTGSGSWLAKCPAHSDRSPSLSIKAADDRILLHCFAGCEAAAVLQSIGLTFVDLFPERFGGTSYGAGEKLSYPNHSPYRLLDLAATEARIVAIGACHVIAGHPLSGEDAYRILVAADTLYEIAREARHGRR